MRLQKFLARAGVASRRGSEDLMTAGRVAVNGEVVTQLGSRVDPTCDHVTVDGATVQLGEGPRYFVMNKPAGYLTTMSDPQGRPCVAELMPPEVPGLFPVGRLDMDTTGVLLLTTDGELAYRLMHPRFHVDKTYQATVEGSPTGRELDRLAAGIELDDGPTAPADISMLGGEVSGALVEITIREGRKRQVKRMFAAIGHPVTKLDRTRFGPVDATGLTCGEMRELGTEEVKALKRATTSGSEYEASSAIDSQDRPREGDS